MPSFTLGGRTRKSSVNAALGKVRERKYTKAWREIKEKGKCEIACTPYQSNSIANEIKKEKVRDKDKDRSKVLDITYRDLSEAERTKYEKEKFTIAIVFKLVIDNSIRNF